MRHANKVINYVKFYWKKGFCKTKLSDVFFKTLKVQKNVTFKIAFECFLQNFKL